MNTNSNTAFWASIVSANVFIAAGMRWAFWVWFSVAILIQILEAITNRVEQ